MSTGRPRSFRASVGFTLIEVIVVIAIVAVLSGMAALSLSGRSGSAGLRASSGELLRFAQYARDHAATRARPCQLVVDVQQRRFYLQSAAVEPQRRGEFELLTGDAMRPRTLPRGVEFGLVRIDRPVDAASGGPAITFTALGEADAALVELTDGKSSFTLRIAPATGRAEIVEGRVEELLSDRMDLDA